MSSGFLNRALRQEMAVEAEKSRFTQFPFLKIRDEANHSTTLVMVLLSLAQLQTSEL
jgi:hypothetical protein